MEETTQKKSPNTLMVAIAALVAVVLVGLIVVLWTLQTDLRKALDAANEESKQNVAKLTANLAAVSGDLDRARQQLELFKEVKTGLDNLVAEMTSRVSAVEGAVPEQQQDLEEFSQNMLEIQKSLNDLGNAVAILRSERVTQEQLAQASDQVEKSVAVVRTSLKKLDKVQARLSGRVTKVEKAAEETSKAVSDLSAGFGEFKTFMETTRKDIAELKAAPKPVAAAPGNDLKFEPSAKDGGPAPPPAPEAPVAPEQPNK